MSSFVVIATRNMGKMSEISSILEGKNFTVLGLDQLEQNLGLVGGSLGNAPEPGVTYEQNAELKAQDIAEAIRKAAKPGDRYVVIADDSGLDVIGAEWVAGADLAAGQCDRLVGRTFPGVDTAPFAKACGGWPKAFEKCCTSSSTGRADAVTVLHVLELVTGFAEGETLSAENFRGSVEGYLQWPPRGNQGFGYDPIFKATPDGKTFAEMSSDEKNDISHRRRALDAMVQNSVALNGYWA